MYAVLASVALMLATPAPAIGVGDKAPSLKVAAILKGKAVNLGKGVHVVEFWATWCGPCKTSIPHLTEMAKRYKGKVDFTGVSVSETGSDQLGQVRKFVANMGSRMDYNVAFDGPAKGMDLGYMEAANQTSIPTAFLVKNGTILWIGHPMDGLDRIIDRVLAGSFNVAKAKAEARRKELADAEDARIVATQNKAMASAQAALDTGDFEAGVKELDKIDVSKDKELAHRVLMKRFYALARLGDPRLHDVAVQLAAEKREDAETLLTVVALDLINPELGLPKSCYPVALILAERAAEIAPKSPMVLDSYATVLAKNGKVNEAAAAESSAIDYAKKDPKYDAAAIKRLQGKLEGFRQHA